MRNLFRINKFTEKIAQNSGLSEALSDINKEALLIFHKYYKTDTHMREFYSNPLNITYIADQNQ